MGNSVKRRELLEKELSRYVALLVERLSPEKIILFGSLAAGEVSEWSDLDLIVVLETGILF